MDEIYIVLAAADYWCDYLEENDREDEIEPIQTAIEAVRASLGA